jgi:hypothetical protein
MGETLFTRLASYSQNPAKQSLENFTTEVLVHLINNDEAFREIFIRHIIRDGRIRLPFMCASAESQQSFGNGIVDLVLSSQGKKILLEIKIAAAETETKIYGKGWVSQIQKYLSYKSGRVAYLTTKAVSAPSLKSERKDFLGQFYFEDIYDHLIKAKSKLTDCGHLFLEFMKENHMKPLEPFTPHELNKAKTAFDFAKKCEDFLNEIKSEVEPKFQKIFRSRARFTGGHFSPTYQSAYSYARGKLLGFQKRKQVEICIWPEGGSLFYGVCVRILRTDMNEFSRHLNNWKMDRRYLYTLHPLKPFTKSEKCVDPILRDLKQLKRALNQIY